MLEQYYGALCWNGAVSAWKREVEQTIECDPQGFSFKMDGGINPSAPKLEKYILPIF